MVRAYRVECPDAEVQSDMSESSGFLSVLRIAEFRALWVAEAQSLLGDQLARVAVVFLAYQRTGSPAVTGLIYALTFLPAVLGGATLSGLADRLPRRTLMIWCDIVRACLVAGMAVAHLPLVVVACLLVAAVIVGRPFAASQLALLPEVLPGRSYVVGTGLRMVTDQLGQLIGFAAGGLVVAAFGPRSALIVDAGTFLLSAMIIRGFVRHRPAARAANRDRMAPSPIGATFRQGVAVVFGDPERRWLLAIGCLAACYVVPEGIAPAYARSIGGGAASAGVLMAALPFGTAAGAAVLVRLPAERRRRLLGPLCVAAAVPLIACGLRPGLALSFVLWAASGVACAYQIEASAAFALSLPNDRRGAAIGLASSTVTAAQGLGLVGFGGVADFVGAPTAVAMAGLCGILLALPCAAAWAHLCRNPGTAQVRPSAL